MTTETSITEDVDRGLAVVAQIKELQKELKAIEARLGEAALRGESEPLVDEEREGRQFLADGTVGRVPIILESDQISGEFSESAEKAARMKELCGARLSLLYKRVVTYARVPKDGKAFRQVANASWPADAAAEIIQAAIARDKHGIAKSRVIVAWDRAE